jgi:hypothetical protein
MQTCDGRILVWYDSINLINDVGADRYQCKHTHLHKSDCKAEGLIRANEPRCSYLRVCACLCVCVCLVVRTSACLCECVCRCVLTSVGLGVLKLMCSHAHVSMFDACMKCTRANVSLYLCICSLRGVSPGFVSKGAMTFGMRCMSGISSSTPPSRRWACTVQEE